MDDDSLRHGRSIDGSGPTSWDAPPTAFNMARAGARLGPSVIAALRRVVIKKSHHPRMDDGPLRISVCLIRVHHPLAADTMASATITATTIRKTLKRVITILAAPCHHIFIYFTVSVMLPVK